MLRVIKDSEIDWLFHHMFYPAYKNNKGYWIGSIGPYRTQLAVIRAAIKCTKGKLLAKDVGK